MEEYDIGYYRDQNTMGAGMIDANTRLTGHHIIPDHCF
jgi:hypothetical protein